MVGGEMNTYHVSALSYTHVVPEVSASLWPLQDLAVPYEFMSLGRFLQSKETYFITIVLRHD